VAEFQTTEARSMLNRKKVKYSIMRLSTEKKEKVTVQIKQQIITCSVAWSHFVKLSVFFLRRWYEGRMTDGGKEFSSRGKDPHRNLVERPKKCQARSQLRKPTTFQMPKSHVSNYKECFWKLLYKAIYQMFFSVRDLYMHCSTEACKSVDHHPFTRTLRTFILVSKSSFIGQLRNSKLWSQISETPASAKGTKGVPREGRAAGLQPPKPPKTEI
jgi:hypothetical protein